tara:strand:- start:2895 stop:3536 length:642 start_codon:yes stop_codon:yes gene_type:complete
MSAYQRTRHLSTYLNTSRKTIIEMLENRGYDMTHHKSFEPAYSNNSSMDPIIVSNDKEVVEVHYELTSTRTNHKNVSKKVNQIVEKRTDEDKKKALTIIFLVSDSMTPSVKEAIRVLTNKLGIFIQVFPIRTLMYNITKHQNVPEHIRIPKSEYSKYVDDLLDSLHIESLDKLPKILDTDPVAMFIGMRPGDLCKITRPSLSAGVHIVYRYCA